MTASLVIASVAKQPHTRKFLLLFLTVLALPLLASADSARVIKVVDGDTLRVFYDNQSELVRLIGIDCPEKRESERASMTAERSGHSLKEIFDLGERSSRFTESKLSKGDLVDIEFDVEKRDRYGRLLGYIYLPNKTMLNREILKQGYAHLLTVPPNVRHKDDFVLAHQEGRTLGRGLWSFDAFADGEPKKPKGVRSRWPWYR